MPGEVDETTKHGVGPEDLRLMQVLARDVMIRKAELVNGDASVGELAWVWGRDLGWLAPYWRHRFRFDEAGDVAAWAWARLPFKLDLPNGEVQESKSAHLTWLTRTNERDRFRDVLGWYDDVAPGIDKFVVVQNTDPTALEIAADHGYVLDEAWAGDDGYWVQFNTRDLAADIPEPRLAEGFRFVTAADVSSAAALKAHIDAWQKTRLDLAGMERIQSTAPYRHDMHVFVAASDGTLAATAVIWFDEESRTAEFEPVGTHIDYRRLGLATALQLHGMRVAKAAGATRMFVPCLGAPAHSAARNLYYSVGFRALSKDLPLVKRA